MTALKTLKQIIEATGWGDIAYRGDQHEEPAVLVSELRDEASKWVKAHSDSWDAQGMAVGNAKQWIIYFFDLSVEDLK